MIRRLLFFLLALGWFALFQPWGSFADPDAFYHAHIASLIAEHGPLPSFPWLSLTTLGTAFADQHFLFHLALIPFIHLFGELAGAQVAAVVFAALCGVACLYALEKLRVVHPVFWASCILVASPMVVRLSLGKASPFAVAWFVLGLTAVARRNPRAVFLVAALFALSHGGWILLLLCITLFTLGEILAARFIEGASWKTSFLSSPWALLANATLGTAVGLVVHPNFKTILQFLWVQVVKIGVAAPFNRVPLGGEWLPTPALELLGSFGPLLLMAPVVALALAKTRTSQNRPLMRLAIGFGVIVATLVALTFKSRRFIEYLVPTFALWLALLWTIADRDALFLWLTETWNSLLPKWPRLRRNLLGALVLLFAAIAVASQGIAAYRQLHGTPRKFTDAKNVMAAVGAATEPGERVFAPWDLFPELFAADDRFHFVAGLDPTFLLDRHPELSDTYLAITQSPSASGTAPLIVEAFKTRTVVLEPARMPALEAALQASASAARIFSDDRFSAYRLGASYPLR